MSLTNKKKLGNRGPSDGMRMDFRLGKNDRRMKHRPFTKRWTLEDLYVAVRDCIHSHMPYVRAERLADALRANPQDIVQCIHRLRHVGYTVEESNPFIDGGRERNWTATVYIVREKE